MTRPLSTVSIAGVGVIGPGLGGWAEAVDVLNGRIEFDSSSELPNNPPSGLPANERRRITPLIRMVLQCCEDATANFGPAAALRSVFSSSCGDLETVDKILASLALPEKPVSPTQFHNSVHNAPAGYWSISRGDQSGSVSISAHDASFCAGLLHAFSHVVTSGDPVLLVAADSMAPPKLRDSRPYLASFAVGLLLVAEPGHWTIGVDLHGASGAGGVTFDEMSNYSLEAMRLGNPAARCLPLLEALARNDSRRIVLPYLQDLAVRVDVTSATQPETL